MTLRTLARTAAVARTLGLLFAACGGAQKQEEPAPPPVVAVPTETEGPRDAGAKRAKGEEAEERADSGHHENVGVLGLLVADANALGVFMTVGDAAGLGLVGSHNADGGIGTGSVGALAANPGLGKAVARIAAGTPTASQGISRDVIRRIIRRNVNRIRYCYEKALQKDPTLGGKIVVRFAIAKDGTVAQASVKTSTLADKTVESCVVGVFRQMRFPQSSGVVVVSYPLVFTSS